MAARVRWPPSPQRRAAESTLSFTKSRTTILVVGRRDRDAWGDAKSGKHQRAEAAIAEGRDVRILTEVEFRRLVDYAVSSAPVRAAV